MIDGNLFVFVGFGFDKSLKMFEVFVKIMFV